MLYEKLTLNIDTGKLTDHLQNHILGIWKPTMQNSSFGGWSVLSSNGKSSDGWYLGHSCYKEIDGRIIFDYKTARRVGVKHALNFKYPTEICTGYLADIMQQVSNLGLYPRRARVSLLKSGGKTSVHRDAPDEDYAVRLHIPIQTNPQCLFKAEKTAHFPADGSGYLISVNKLHQVLNLGAKDRYHLIMQVWDTEHISKYFQLENPGVAFLNIIKDAAEFDRKILSA